VRTVRSLQGGQVPVVADYVPAVTTHDPEVVDGLLGLLRDRRVPALDDGEEQILSRYQQELVLESFRVFGRGAVRPAIKRLLREGETASPDVTAAALLALGAVGESNDLRRLMTLALPDDVERPERVVEQALESALTRVLEHDPRGFEHLAVFWQQMRLELLPVVIRAVGATSDPNGVEVLGQMVRWRPELAPLAVAQLRRLGPAPEPSVNEDLADLLRPRLDPEDVNLCRAVVLALGELEDFHAVPRLIQLLDEPHGIGENALWALRRLSGCDWGSSPDWWKHWYESEAAWYRNGHRQALQRLTSARQGTVAEALREYAEHRLFRHTLAAEVEEVLYRTEPTLRLLACEALGALGSRRSLPVLREVAGDDDPALQEAARAALATIAGALE
jgi:HEAT repeat protein